MDLLSKFENIETEFEKTIKKTKHDSYEKSIDWKREIQSTVFYKIKELGKLENLHCLGAFTNTLDQIFKLMKGPKSVRGVIDYRQITEGRIHMHLEMSSDEFKKVFRAIFIDNSSLDNDCKITDVSEHMISGSKRFRLKVIIYKEKYTEVKAEERSLHENTISM